MYQTPDLNKQSFALTNSQTILQRIALLQEFVPSVNTIAEICCGDCTRQFQAYSNYLKVQTYRGVDIEASVVAENMKQGIECYCGDALDKEGLPRRHTSLGTTSLVTVTRTVGQCKITTV